MNISYEKMTEADFLQLSLFQLQQEKNKKELDILVDTSKTNTQLSRVKKVSFHQEVEIINISFIQLESDFFQENLSYLSALVLVFGRSNHIQDINIRIYSHRYDYYQTEINSILYSDTSGRNGQRGYKINTRRILTNNFLRKTFGGRLTGIAYRIFRFIKKPFR